MQIFEKPTRRRTGRMTALAAGSVLLLGACGEGSNSDMPAPTGTSALAERSAATTGYNCGEKRADDVTSTAKAGEVAIKFCYGGEGSTIVLTSAGPKGEASHTKVGSYHGAEGAEDTSKVDCQVTDGRPVEMPGTGKENDIWYGIAPDSRVPGVSAEFVPDAFVKIDFRAAAHLPLCGQQ